MSDNDPPDQRTSGEWLRQVFPTLREPLLSQTASQLQHEHFAAGTVIIRQGEEADALFIIVKGRARVVREDRSGTHVPVATLGAGQFFGEMALLAGGSRSASVVAESDLDVLILDRDGLRGVIAQGPEQAPLAPLSDGRSGNGLPTVAHQDEWLRAVRSACHALVTSHHTVRSIDVLGRPDDNDQPASLLRLTDLARRVASEYGIEVSVSHVGRRPVLHLSTSRNA